ncbi:cytochrome ubiquinol oxidase subunit I [Desulfobulbus sp.]|uniref:cytochrome ubiquinol oxidase subunit I n=1 Tax=Desulfobulbus sp. TaxID=895 RepID=UPI00286F5E25|nr:cytochrome ubiquinol oxidase subunit I [Desulfobulbus sp.]
MNYPVWQLDFAGGGLLVALIAVFHVYIAHFAVGGGLFLALAERKACRENSPAMLAYVRAHAHFFLMLTMVAGAISGVGIWFVISLLNPTATSILIHTFVFVWAAEWVCFLVEIVSLFLYVYSFDRLPPGRHRLLAWIYGAAAWLSLFLINGIISFMLTPGDWTETKNIWDGFFNPGFWPSLAFRTFFALIIAGLFGLVTATWIKDRSLRTIWTRFCSRWLILPFLFFFAAAIWYRTALPPELQEIIWTRMPSVRPFIDGFLFCAPVPVLGGLLLMMRLPAGLSRLLAILLLLVGQIVMGCFEFVREGARRPYILRDYLYTTSVARGDTGRLQSEGILAVAKWVRNRQITDDNRLEAGRELYNLLCLSCHAIGGPMRDIKRLAASYTPSGLDAMISGMHTFHPVMPPFTGTAEERRALAWFIAHGLNNRSDPPPARLAGKLVEIPPFDPAANRFVLVAWSTLGMRYVAEVEGLLSVFPPGNSLRAQLIERGETPTIVNQNVTLRYRVEHGFTDSDRHSTPTGDMLPEEDLFTADGILLLPTSRHGFDPYPVVAIEARDNNENLLAATKVVAPVSTEMGCATCHGGPAGPEEYTGLNRATALNILEAHDRLSGTTLLASAQSGAMIRCQSCHADLMVRARGEADRLNLSTAIHGFHAHYLRGREADACAFCHPASPTGATRSLRDIHASLGLTCTNCHGTMENHALGLLQQERTAGKQQAARLMAPLMPRAVVDDNAIVPRNPWINQPDCLHCHVDYQPPATDTTSNTWTAGEQELYRNRTDESGRLFCAACHSSPHALYPADNPHGERLDVLQPLQYQGNRLPLGANRSCSVCHTLDMNDELHHDNSLRTFRNE